jgi:hypothetical protein
MRQMLGRSQNLIIDDRNLSSLFDDFRRNLPTSYQGSVWRKILEDYKIQIKTKGVNNFFIDHYLKGYIPELAKFFDFCKTYFKERYNEDLGPLDLEKVIEFLYQMNIQNNES